MSTFHEIELHYHICCVMPRTLKTTYNCINQAVNSMSGQCQENMNYIHLLRYRQYLGATNATTTARKTRITATATAATTTVTTTTTTNRENACPIMMIMALLLQIITLRSQG